MPSSSRNDPATAFRRRAADAGLQLASVLTYGPYVLNLDRYELTVDGVAVELSALHIELLAVFMAAPDRVWSRHELNALTGGRRAESRRIDVRLARLRQSLGADVFRSIIGRGWIMRSPDHIKGH
jgi:DNA-binding response OmpR family regulator